MGLGVGVNDRLEGENVILGLITDDVKSVPPVMWKPNIKHTHAYPLTLSYWVV